MPEPRDPGAPAPPVDRVVMVFPALQPEFAGGGLQGLRLMERLAARGLRMTALAPIDAGVAAPAEESAFGGRLRRFRVVRRHRSAWAWRFGVQAAAWLWRHRDAWQLLHVHEFGYYAVLPMWVARALGRPVVIKTPMLTADGQAYRLGSGPLGRLVTSVHREVAAVVVLSRELEERVRADAAVADRAVRIPNGVDTERFAPREPAARRALRAELGLPGDAFVVVTCGEIGHRKNPVALVRAAARLRHRPVILVLAGPPGPDPADARALEAAMAALPEGVEARLPGDVPPDEVPRWLAAADVLTLTSRNEGLPNSVLEGMASGLPCVASDIPGSRDVLEDGGGELVPLDDDAALAARLDALAADPDRRAELGRIARARAEREFAFERIAGRYLALYGRVRAGLPPAEGAGALSPPG